MTKRGQLTVFIIAGIAILFLTAGIFYVVQLTAEKGLEAEKEKVTNLESMLFR